MCLVSPASCDRMGGVGLVEVSFDGGGAKGMLPPNQIVVIGSFITVPGDYGLIPPEGGFLYFTGWKDENGALYREGIKLKPLTNMTLTAQWGDDLGWRYAGFSPEGSGTGKISIEFDGIVGTLEKSDIKFIPSLVDVVGLKWAEPRKWDLDVVVNKPDSPYFNMSIEKPGIDPEITVFVDATTGSTSLAGVAAVSAGANHSLAVRSDGSLWSWGGNENGQLGNGSTGTNNAKPERVGTDTDWKRVSAGGGFSLAIRQDGSLWAWGNRANGRLGTGSAVGTQPVPERVGSDGDWYSVSAGSDHVLAVKNDGSLWTWGGNGSGQLGNGSTGDVSAPRAIQGTWKEASAGDGFSLAIRQDGGLWAWGNGENGRLGTGASGGTQPVPERVGSDGDWTAVSAGAKHALGIRGDNGGLWAWGDNSAGQVGSDNAPVPQKVTSTPSPRSVHAGNGRSLVIDTAGTLWTLEGNGAVELPGDARLSLVQLSFGGTVEDVSAGGRHDLVLIVFADNSTVLYARGANESGQLSNGSFDGNGYVTVPF